MKASVRKVLARLGATVDDTQQRLHSLAAEVDVAVPEGGERGPTILFGPSFSIYRPCYLHDAVLSMVLRARGASIVPIFCDQIQETACNVYGGDWGGDYFEENCRNCDFRSRALWSATDVDPLPLSRWIEVGDREEIAQATSGLGRDWATYEAGGMAIGAWADAIVRNMALVGTTKEAPRADELGHVHLRNLLLLARTYERAIEEVGPDRIVTNDSYYGMWALLEHLADRHGIPFYSTWQGPRPGTWVYAHGAPAMERELEVVWEAFAARPLDDAVTQRVEGWLDRRPTGEDLTLDTATPLGGHDRPGGAGGPGGDERPTALLAANVVWDLAALDRQLLYGDMVTWVAETIRWFARHPEYRLIVKAHPGEEHPDIPQTRERLIPALERRGVLVPENVILMPPRSSWSVYDLMATVDVSIVHTSTVGVEMAAHGVPVIATGDAPYRGFGLTLDPGSRAEYEAMLERGLTGGLDGGREDRRRFAHHYIDLEYFHYSVETGFLDREGDEWVLNVSSMDELAPGRRPQLDHVVTAILEGEAILGPERWPPPPGP